MRRGCWFPTNWQRDHRDARWNIDAEPISSSAVEYIRRQLGQGESLAKALLETVDSAQRKRPGKRVRNPFAREKTGSTFHLWNIVSVAQTLGMGLRRVQRSC